LLCTLSLELLFDIKIQHLFEFVKMVFEHFFEFFCHLDETGAEMGGKSPENALDGKEMV